MHRLQVKFKDKQEKKDKKDKKEKSHHFTLHHHHEAPPVEAVTEVVAEAEAPEVTPVPTFEKKPSLKHRRKRSNLSGLFSPHDTDSSPVVEPPALPLRRMPSVIITDDLLKKLWDAWDRGPQPIRPAQWLVMVSQLAIKTMASQHVEFKKDNLELMSALSARFKVLSEAVNQAEAIRAEFQVDPDLYNAKNTLEREMNTYQEQYSLSVLIHDADVARHRAKIEDIDQKKTDVTAETVIQKLRDLTVYQSLHQEIMENIRRTEQVLKMQGCFKKMFFCKPDAEVSRLNQQMGQLEQKRAMLATGTPDEIRDMLMAKLEAEREEARAALDALSTQHPVFDNQAKQAFLQAEATILNAEQTYYKQVTPAVMRSFLEVLTLIEVITEVIPRPNPLTSAMNTSALSAAMEPAADVHLCELVDTLRDRLRGQLLEYYCMEPGKFLFEVYHLRLNQLPMEQRSAFMTGKADDAVMKAIFHTHDAGDALHASASLRL